MALSISPGLILRESQPDNLEYAFDTLDGLLTPNENFYVRNHFPSPQLNSETWRLRIEGAVANPLELTYADLRSLPATRHIAVLECAGNSRVFLTPKVEGVQWGPGAVGCAEWTGVSLAAVLERAKIQANAVSVLLEGADEGIADKTSRPKDKIHYARSLPLAQAVRPDVLLAYEMNGKPLPEAHGAPVRAIVPGWYAMASVKWLTRIYVLDRASHAYFETVDYAYWTEPGGLPPERVPITEIAIKSAIARPALQERVRLGTPYRIRGAAWSADAAIGKVEVSTDDGKTWSEASLAVGSKDHAWQLWEFEWTPRAAGVHVLRSRATDAAGRTQPAEHDRNTEGYVVHHALPVTVEVAS